MSCRFDDAHTGYESQFPQGTGRRSIRVVLILALTGIAEVNAELYFNVNALRLSPEQKALTDLETLSRTDVQVPGTYRVQLRVNGIPQGEHRLNFVICNNRLCPELTVGLLRDAGVKIHAFPGTETMSSTTILPDITKLIPRAKTELDFEQHILELTLPQAALVNPARGDVPPEQWEDGLPMAFISYSISGSNILNHTDTRKNHDFQYINLRNGVNSGPWRLRNYSYYNRSRRGIHRWNSMQTWLERDIRSLRGRLVTGETATPGLVSENFRFRGIAFSTQDEMLADSQRGYAPEVRGIAATNATVEIHQNGSLLYQTFVPAGPFVISDLYPTSTSGDLEITVREEDGTVRRSIQSFASPPVAVRYGMIKYSVTTGEYRPPDNNKRTAKKQHFAQGELLYGWRNTTTLYGGLTAAEHYHSATVGTGVGMGLIGAMSLDVTHARTQFTTGQSADGQSWRMRYSKRFELTGTSMTLAGYRYNSDGYYNFDEASNWYQQGKQAIRYALKNKAQLTLNQSFGILGSGSLSAWHQHYRNHDMSRTGSVTASWSKSFNGVAVTLGYNQNRRWRTGRTNHVSSFSISLPVSKGLSPAGTGNVRLSNSGSLSNSGASTLSSTLSGTLLENNRLSWSVSQARNRQSNGQVTNSSALSATLLGGTTSASLGYANYYGQRETINWAMRGSLVAHPYGITLSQQLSEGSAWVLVKAPGAQKVKIKNRSGLSTDSRGYAVVPSLTPYRKNEISLDTASLDDNVDLIDAIRHQVPSRESLVLAEYSPRIGKRVFLTLTRQGKPLPLGSTVNAGGISGITDERGRVYMAGVPDFVELDATLAGGEHCRVTFSATDQTQNNGIFIADLPCE